MPCDQLLIELIENLSRQASLSEFEPGCTRIRLQSPQVKHKHQLTVCYVFTLQYLIKSHWDTSWCTYKIKALLTHNSQHQRNKLSSRPYFWLSFTLKHPHILSKFNPFPLSLLLECENQWSTEEKEKEQKGRRSFLPLYCQDAAHGGGGGGCGRLLNHSCGGAVGGGRCGGDGQADGHALFCIS